MTTNKNSIIRLSRYRNALNRFKALGLVKVFSDNLADATGATSAQVRKDFSIFGLCGNKRAGYKVNALIEKLNHILGKNKVQKVILVGVGKLGGALLKYKGFEKEGIKIVASFDLDPDKYSYRSGVHVFPMDVLHNFVRKNNIKVGIIAVPDTAAQGVADAMFAAGIKGILNFAPISLIAKPDCVINNVNLEVELENLIYFVNTL